MSRSASGTYFVAGELHPDHFHLYLCYPKLCNNMPNTRFQPSTNTNRISFMGKLTIVGGNIIMPLETVTDETTKSKTKNGKKI